MTATVDPAPAPRQHPLLPFGDRSRGRRLVKVAAWFAAIALVVALLELLGVDVAGWFSDLWDALTGIGAGYLAAGWALGREELSPRGEVLARRVVGAGTRMERLIRDLLDWSRMQGGAAIPIHPREADLAEVCRRMADELRDRDGARIEVEQRGDTSAVFDPARVEQVVSNLVANALRHGLAGGPVRVRAVGTAGEVRAEVENEGPEIPADAQAQIFEAFRQGPSGQLDGVGLGLFIVRALTEAHGGRVSLASAAGRTTFVVHLPRAAPGAPAAPPSAAG